MHPTRAAAEHAAVLHYRRPGGDYDGWGLHVWNGAATPTDWAQPAAARGHGRVRREVHRAAADNATSCSTTSCTRATPRTCRPTRRSTWSPSGTRCGSSPARRSTCYRSRPQGTPRHRRQPGQGGLDRPRHRRVARRADRRAQLRAVSAPAGGLWSSTASSSATAHGSAMSAVPGNLTEPQRAKFPHLWAYPGLPRRPGDRAALRRGPARAGRRRRAGRDRRGDRGHRRADRRRARRPLRRRRGARLGPVFDGGRARPSASGRPPRRPSRWSSSATRRHSPDSWR